MDRERIDNWCEKTVLGLVLAILVGGPLLLGGTREWGFLPLQALTMCVMAVWGLRLWISPQPKLLWPPICWAVAAFVVYAAVRYDQADIEWVARRELLRVLVYAFLFYAILNNLHRQECMQIIAVTLVFLANGTFSLRAVVPGGDEVAKDLRDGGAILSRARGRDVHLSESICGLSGNADTAGIVHGADGPDVACGENDLRRTRWR